MVFWLNRRCSSLTSGQAVTHVVTHNIAMGLKILLAFLLVGVLLSAQDQPDPLQRRDGPPQVRYRKNPHYTKEARKRKIEGLVSLSIVVDEKGTALDPKVVRGLGYGLDEAAINAVKTWIFWPGIKGGKPVRWHAVIDVSFQLANP